MPAKKKDIGTVQCTLDRPDCKSLKLEEAAVYLEVPVPSLELWIAEGKIPPLSQVGKREQTWPWQVVVAIDLLLQARCLSVPADKEKGSREDRNATEK